MYNSNSDDICNSYVRNSWSSHIENELPKLDNTKYKVNLSILYNSAKCEYDINCYCDVIKSIDTNVKIPQHVLTQRDLNDFHNYMNLVIENLSNKINNIESCKNCIEINGVKYYPKEE